jgi:hypothetical protein
MEGKAMPCEDSGTDCPTFTRRIVRKDGTSRDVRRYIGRGSVGKYGEWFRYSQAVTFEASQCELGTTCDPAQDATGWVISFENFEKGIELSMDDFMFELPSEKSFASNSPTNEQCKELAINGDAEDNDGEGYAYFPFYSSNYNRFVPQVLEETVDGKVNRFYRTRGRQWYWDSMRFVFLAWTL